MRKSAIFAESFLDGLTMAGFLQRLQRPSEPARLMEPPSDRTGWATRVFEMGASNDAEIALRGDLHRVPEPALRKMIVLLEKESEYRKAHPSTPVQTFHGAS